MNLITRNVNFDQPRLTTSKVADTLILGVLEQWGNVVILDRIENGRTDCRVSLRMSVNMHAWAKADIVRQTVSTTLPACYLVTNDIEDSLIWRCY